MEVSGETILHNASNHGEEVVIEDTLREDDDDDDDDDCTQDVRLFYLLEDNERFPVCTKIYSNGCPKPRPGFRLQWRSPAYQMEGQFSAEYLGSSTLPKGTTGLGLIQKPLKEYYISYKKSQTPNNVQSVTIRVAPQGIVFIFQGDHSGQRKDLYFDMASIIYIEAVKFTVSKGTDKKLHCGFLPMDESRLPAKGREKLFSLLDKKLGFLAQTDHPPLLTCVMRRTSGVKSLDCHVFVVESANDAYRIVSYVESVQRGQVEPLESGLSRSDSDKYARDREGYYRDASDYRGQQYRHTSGDYSRDIRRDNSYNDRRDRYSDGPAYYPGPEPQGGPYYEKSREIDRRDRHSGSDKGSRNELNPKTEGYYDRNRMSDHSEPISPRNGYGNRNEFINSPRPRSPRDQHFLYSDRIERRDHYSDWNEQTDNYGGHDRRSAELRSPRSPHYEQSQEMRPTRAVSPIRNARPHVESPRSPRLQDSFDEPVYSASNMENRQDLEKKIIKAREDEQRGIAKVPPHVTAGVKVLPSVVPVMLKKTQSPPPVKKVPKEIINEERYADDDDPYDNYIPREGYFYYDDSGHKQILTGAGWKADKEHPYGYGNDVPPDVLPRHEKVHQYGKQRDQNQYGNFMYNRNQDSSEDRTNVNYPSKGQQDHRHKTEQSKPWSYDDQFQRHSQNGDYRYKKSPTETGFVPGEFRQHTGGNGYREHEKIPKGKDAEIESMFSYLNVDHNSSDNLQTSGENFEQSLGYFP